MKVNHFVVDDWEVAFLQNRPITVCVIRNIKKLDPRFIGMAVCNPNDKWNNAEGRHKALKDALTITKPNISWALSDDEIDTNSLFITLKNEGEREIRLTNMYAPHGLPIKAIQKAYWDHYKDEELTGKDVIKKWKREMGFGIQKK